jgi:SPP1 family predicted phage head-tail adaptor
MQTGRYRHRLILERRVDTKQPSGQVVHTYTEFAEILGSVEALSGREFFAAAQVQADVSTRIRMHWRDDVDETCRVVHIVNHDSPMKVELYDITAVLPDAKTGRREIQLMCTKRIAEGWRRGQ